MTEILNLKDANGFHPCPVDISTFANILHFIVVFGAQKGQIC